MSYGKWILGPVKAAKRRRRYRKMLNAAIDADDFTVSVAHTAEEYEAAFRLVAFAYMHEGYLSPRAPSLRYFSQHTLPEAVVLIVKHHRRTDGAKSVSQASTAIVGTMSVILDSPAGLPLDEQYPQELQQFRQDGERMVEYGALAVLGPYNGSPATMLLNMAAYWVSKNLLGAQRLVIGINPRAVQWHHATMAFSSFGREQDHRKLAAPVHGMTHRLVDFESFQQKHYRQKLRTGLSAHEHFFINPIAAVRIPPVASLAELNRWKLPRTVFRQLFVGHEEVPTPLTGSTLAYLATCRSPNTLHGIESSPRPRAPMASGQDYQCGSP